MANQSLPCSDRILLSTEPLPQAPQPPIGSSLVRSPDSLEFPFQYVVDQFNGSTEVFLFNTPSSSPAISNLTKFVRDAYLTHIEAVVYPSALSLKVPITIDLAWTPADLNIVKSNVLAVPSSSRFTIGGLSILHSGSLPCDLAYINPIVKSPIPYTNSPKLYYQVYTNPDAANTSNIVKATLVVRGRISLSHPTISSSS